MKIFSTIIALLLSATALPQVSLDEYLGSVQENNKSLSVAKQYLVKEQLKSKTGAFPANPEAEFGYLWSDPSAFGNRRDLSITQTLDFPTVYFDRAQLAGLYSEKASFYVQLMQQEILLKARNRWIESVYLNKKEVLLSGRLTDSEEVLRIVDLRYRNGEISKLQLNKASIMLASIRTEMESLNTSIENNASELVQLNGGFSVVSNDSSYPKLEILPHDSLIARFINSPQYGLYESEARIKSQNKDMVVGENLPKLMAGYYSEDIPALRMNGVKVGLSIPLWENANTIKTAKNEMVLSELNQESFIYEETVRFEQLFRKWESLKTQVNDLQAAIDGTNDIQLLKSMIRSGEITATEYYMEAEGYFHAMFQLLDLERDLQLAHSELLKYDL